MKSFESFFRDAYTAVRQRRPAGEADSAFRDLSLVFTDAPQPVFLDWVHIGEAGNETIARIMATDVVGLMKARPAAPKPGPAQRVAPGR